MQSTSSKCIIFNTIFHSFSLNDVFFVQLICNYFSSIWFRRCTVSRAEWIFVCFFSLFKLNDATILNFALLFAILLSVFNRSFKPRTADETRYAKTQTIPRTTETKTKKKINERDKKTVILRWQFSLVFLFRLIEFEIRFNALIFHMRTQSNSCSMTIAFKGFL